MKVANDSFSQRSFHHFMVTRFPNHMWPSSCKFVLQKPAVFISVFYCPLNRYASL